LKIGYHGQSWGSWAKDKLISSPASFAVSSLWNALGYENTPPEHALTEKFVFVPALKVNHQFQLDFGRLA